MGILLGLEKAGWKDVPVVAMETKGADCFNLSIKEDKVVEITLTSIAKTLGARSVIPQLLEKRKEFRLISQVLPDKEAVHGCLRFSDDQGFLVEPSCGVTLASVYSGLLPSVLESTGYHSEGPIVLVVCGGSDVNQEILEDFKNTFGAPGVEIKNKNGFNH